MPSSINDVLLRLKVEGGKVVASEVDRVGDSVDGLGDSTSKANKESGKMSAVFGQIKQAAKVGGAALGAMGAQSVWAGINFNAQFESANATFATFLGNTKKAEEFTDRLRTVSSKSPLRLTDYMEGAKQLLGFGMAAKNVVPTLGAVNKAVVATGKGSPEMQRIVTALGQMQAKGKVSAEEMLQLAEAGVPAYKILQKQLGLTKDQMANIGNEGIGANRAIKAITKGWNKQFGKAYNESKDTFNFQWSMLKKDFEKFQREALEPVFEFLRTRVLPAASDLLKFLDKLPKKAKTALVGGALLAGLAAFSGPLALIVLAIGAVVFVVAKFHKQIGGFFSGIGKWIGQAARNVGQWVSTAAKNVAGFVTSLVPVIVAVEAVKVAFSVLKPIVGGVVNAVGVFLGFFGQVVKVQFTAMKIYIQTAWNVIKRLGAIVGNVVAIISNLLRGDFSGAWRAAGRLVGNVFGIIKALAQGALQFIRTIPGQILGIFAGIPGRISSVVGGMFDGIKNAFKSAINWVIDKFNWFLDQLRSFSISIPEVDLGPAGSIGGGEVRIPGVPGPIPGLAGGGSLRTPGSVWVGERGPELLSLPKGAQVTPLEKSSAGGTFIAQLLLDSEQVAEAVFERASDAAAIA